MEVPRFFMDREQGETHATQNAGEHAMDEASCIVYVYNLTHNATERHLDEIFGFYGGIRRLRLYARVDEQPHAVIEYESEASADEAVVHMDQGQIDGARVCVTLHEEPQREALAPRPSTRSRRGWHGRTSDRGWGQRRTSADDEHMRDACSPVRSHSASPL